jgi:hypothetical protein
MPDGRQAGRQQAVGDLMASNYYDYLHCRNIINTSGGRDHEGPGSSVILLARQHTVAVILPVQVVLYGFVIL